MAEKDLYDILGVRSNATEKEIEKASRRLARNYHPDLNPGDKQAEEQFKGDASRRSPKQGGRKVRWSRGSQPDP